MTIETLCEFCQLLPTWRVLRAGRDWHERAPACRPCYVTARALWILALDGDNAEPVESLPGVAAHPAGVRDGESAAASEGDADGNLRAGQAGRAIARGSEPEPEPVAKPDESPQP